MKTLEQLNAELDANIPRSAVSSREGGGGRSLSYLAGHYVIDRLNKVFGPLNWACKTEMLQLVHQSAESVHYIAQVRLVVEGPEGKKTEHTCTGYGDGKDKNNIGKAHELAVKEAETDALKRCAKNLGMSMGLALYDKDQPNVEDEPKPYVASRPSAPAPSRPALANAAVISNRETLNKSINTLAKIVNSKGAKTIDAIKASMLQKYGTDVKEKLSDAQASELKAELETLAG